MATRIFYSIVFLLGITPMVLGQALVWGTTHKGGNYDKGVIYCKDPKMDYFRILHHFDGQKGAYPQGGLIEGGDGAFYGVATQGGANGLGVLFRLTDAGTYEVAHHFDLCDGTHPYYGLTKAADGMLYGMTAGGGENDWGTLFTYDIVHKKYKVLWNFTYEDGGRPQSDLLEGQDGNLYGTFAEGGAMGAGGVFKYDVENQKVIVLYHFDYYNGGHAYGRLQEDDKGMLYGTTQCGGKHGEGVLFRIHNTGKNYKVLIAFEEIKTGGNPYGGVVQYDAHLWVGLTNDGGKYDAGTLFEFNTKNNTFKVLHAFAPTQDGGYPEGELAIDPHIKTIWGTTGYGGEYGAGTLFEYTKTDGFKVLHAFDGTNGKFPYGGAYWQDCFGTFFR